MMGNFPEYNLAVARACRALKKLGHQVLLLESHAASLAEDQGFCDICYFEPINRLSIEKVIAKERPNSILATVGGQNTLNIALLIHHFPHGISGNLSFFGTTGHILETTQNAEIFINTVSSFSAKTPESFVVNKHEKGVELGKTLGFPIVVRPVLAPGGIGTSITYNKDELDRAVAVALAVSQVKKVVIEKSLAGWKRTEWEVMRDLRGNTTVIGGVEYIEPLGIHSADSPAVSPVQTLSEHEITSAKTLSTNLINKFNITGTATVQLAHNPSSEEVCVMSVDPRITRTSLWIERTEGTHVSEWHTFLCAGKSLEELNPEISEVSRDLFNQNETKTRIWCRMPLFPDSRLMGKNETLTTYNKSVGNVAGVDIDFSRALQKAVESIGMKFEKPENAGKKKLLNELAKPLPTRILNISLALNAGISAEEIRKVSGIDIWFIKQLNSLLTEKLNTKHVDILPSAKSKLSKTVFKSLGSSNYSGEEGVSRSNSVLLISSGSSLTERGFEYEYILAQAVRELYEIGKYCVLLSPNPLHLADEAGVGMTHYVNLVSPENIEAVIKEENPTGIILQFENSLSSKIIDYVKKCNVPVLGTKINSIERLRKRNRFQTLLQKLDVRMAPHGIAKNEKEVSVLIEDIGFPVMVHPSNPQNIPKVAVWYDEQDADAFIKQANQKELFPMSIESFLETGKEFHLDAVADGKNGFIAGIVEHVEEAGVHAADSAAFWPSTFIPENIINEANFVLTKLVAELKLCGFVGVKFAFAEEKLFLLDILPFATKSSGFIHKVTGQKFIPKVAKVLCGNSLSRVEAFEPLSEYLAVRAPIFPFPHFPNSDASLGPESCSIGEAVSFDHSFGIAYAKAISAAGNIIPTSGNVFLSIADRDKKDIIPLAKKLRSLGFGIIATPGTAEALNNAGLPGDQIMKIQDGRPNIIDKIIDGDVQLIISTPGGKGNRIAEAQMRHEAVDRKILVITTIAGARAIVAGIESFMRFGFDVFSLDEYMKKLRRQEELNFIPQNLFD